MYIPAGVTLTPTGEAMTITSFPSFGRGFDSHRPLHKSC
jgi:hypothetical protein